ncbi:MAG: BCCT family transporter [Pseudomonadota bacterium]
MTSPSAARKGLRRAVFAGPLLIFVLLIMTSLIAPQALLRTASWLNTLILDLFAYAFAWVAFGFVLTCLWAALSPLGKIRIGGAAARPIVSRWNWMAITLTTTLAIGILFWATAEPIYHLTDPGERNVSPGSAGAAQFALSSLYMHWSVTPYAIYTVAGLTFALAYHSWRLPFSLASPFRIITGRPVPRVAEDSLDGLAVLALLLGLSSSLGTGILSLAGSLDRISGSGTGPWVTGLFALLIICGFAASSMSGLQRGIKYLSDINTRLFIVFLIAVFLFGPTVQIVKMSGGALIDYGMDFLPRSLLLAPFDNLDWSKSWTIFYIATWLAWAPLAAMFLGRIARGYTVREYVFVNLVLPASFSILWMSIFGGLAITLEMNSPGTLSDILSSGGPERVLYAVLNTMPMGLLLAVIIVLLSYLSYVTAADSSTSVLAQITDHDSEPRPDGVQPPRIGPKLVFACAVGLTGWIMISLSGIDGVRMLSNLGGLPALFIVGAFNLVLIWMGTKGLKVLRDA